jgi:hypothetical protein
MANVARSGADIRWVHTQHDRIKRCVVDEKSVSVSSSVAEKIDEREGDADGDEAHDENS